MCPKCGNILPLDNFYFSSQTVDGRYGWCKDCHAKASRERYDKNNADKVAKTKEKEELLSLGKRRCAMCGIIFDISETVGNFYVSYCNECNEKAMERDRERGKKYWHEHKERQLENGRKYRENNLEHCREVARKRVREKRNTDVVFRLKHNVRSSIRWAFVGMGKRKNRHTEDIIGINLDDFVKYLLKTFSDRYGREWDGVEKVHIDHIIPLATAKTEEDVLKLCDYRNLQLITASDNQRKHDKIGWDDYEINKQV